MLTLTSLQTKIKVQLKLSISRLRMVQQKDTAIAKQQRRAMAQLLEVVHRCLRRTSSTTHANACREQQGKEESARIRVENIIRSDITTELHEILELYCELLLARIGLLEAKECDAGLEEAVKSVIYAAPRTDVKELQMTRQLLLDKYGKEFALQALENSDGKVSERVLQKLRVEPPPQELVTLYLTEIARTYGVDWPKRKEADDPVENEDDDDDDNPSGGQAIKSVEEPLTTDELTRATPPRDLGPKSPVSVAPPHPSTDNVSPKVRLPQPPELKPTAKMSGLNKQTPGTPAASTSADGDGATKKKKIGQAAVGGKIPDVDELAARFAALKK